MMLEQINHRLRALQEKVVKGDVVDLPTPGPRPRHALRPPPNHAAFPDRVQTPLVIDGKQIGIIHGEKPMNAKSRKAVTEVVRTAIKSMRDGTLKTITAPPQIVPKNEIAFSPATITTKDVRPVVHRLPKEKKMPKPKKEPMTSVRHDNVPGAKTIGVKIAPELYARLEQIKERHKLKTIKDALVLAAERGVYKLHEDDTAALP